MKTTGCLLILTLSMLLLSSCAASAKTTPAPKTIRYLALGDSYTIGESVSANERWPVQLVEGIKASPAFQSMNPNIELTLIARTGWTTDELWKGIEQRALTPPYDLVSLLIGVNNQYRGRSLEEYREQFRFLLGKAIEYAGNDPENVFVVSIPDWGITPFASGRNSTQIAAEIDAFNAINRAEAEAAGVAYVDITPTSRAALNDRSLIAADGLHPSEKMYAEWVKLILPIALQSLK